MVLEKINKELLNLEKEEVIIHEFINLNFFNEKRGFNIDIYINDHTKIKDKIFKLKEHKLRLDKIFKLKEKLNDNREYK